MQVTVYYFGTCGNNTNAINNHNTFRIMVAELTLTLDDVHGHGLTSKLDCESTGVI